MDELARLHTAGLGVVSGASAGLVAGFIARVDMRVVAVSAGMRPTFTLGGSLAPVGLGALAGAAFGLLFVFVRPYLPGPRQGWLAQGLSFGLLLFLALELPLYLWQPDFRGELSLAPGYLGIALFGPLPLIYGILVGLAGPRWDGCLPASLPPRSATLAGFFGLLVVGTTGLAMVIWGLAQAILEAGP